MLGEKFQRKKRRKIKSTFIEFDKVFDRAKWDKLLQNKREITGKNRRLLKVN